MPDSLRPHEPQRLPWDPTKPFSTGVRRRTLSAQHPTSAVQPSPLSPLPQLFFSRVLCHRPRALPSSIRGSCPSPQGPVRRAQACLGELAGETVAKKLPGVGLRPSGAASGWARSPAKPLRPVGNLGYRLEETEAWPMHWAHGHPGNAGALRREAAAVPFRHRVPPHPHWLSEAARGRRTAPGIAEARVGSQVKQALTARPWPPGPGSRAGHRGLGAKGSRGVLWHGS